MQEKNRSKGDLIMNKNAIKNYAVWARTELMKKVAQKAYEYDVTESNLPDFNTNTVHDRLLSNDEKKQLNELIRKIKESTQYHLELIKEGKKKKNKKDQSVDLTEEDYLKAKSQGFNFVVEEVAYTWFNRFIALRYMEVNNYLPQRIRVFTNDNNEFKPDLLTDAIHIELDGLDKQKVFDYIEENKQEELYKYLLLTLCNDMNQYLPDMFTSIKDYKTLLFPDNLLKDDSVLARLITDIDEDSWMDQVQIIGWLYQYYNSELKDIVMKKKNYTKDDIPAVTQLFTPDWIVRYMTENSLGRLWLDGHPNFNHTNWKYYLEEAEQEPDVIEQLNKIKEEHAKLKPEDIKVIDPCMGSGHILVYAFDVLMDIYRDAGYSDRDAAKSILENNLYGLEIDERAYHLAYFALMMKARQYNRRILRKDTKFNLVEIREPINTLKPEFEQYLDNYVDLAHYLVNIFQDAKELGSILNLDCTLEQLNNLKSHLDQLNETSIEKDLVAQSYINELTDLLKPLIKQAKLLVQKYDVVITNPPYMAPSAKQKSYVQKFYKDYKTDLFAVFEKKCKLLNKDNGYQAMIILPSFLFLSSFENARKKLLNTQTICSLLHMGRGIFGIDFGSTSFVLLNNQIDNYSGRYFRLHERTFQYIDPDHIAQLYLDSKLNPSLKFNFQSYDTKNEIEYSNDGLQLAFNAFQQSFSKIPGSPIAYWACNQIINDFKIGKSLNTYVVARNGMKTGDNDRFIRLWFETNNQFLKLDALSLNQAIAADKKWFPYNKGGAARKWYGNEDYVVNWENRGFEIFNNAKKDRRNVQNYPDEYKFSPIVTWSLITSGKPTFRFKNNCISDIGGMSLYDGKDSTLYYLALCNSKVAEYILKILAPTINFQAGDIGRIPLLGSHKEKMILENSNECVQKSKSDWDSFENSWDFKVHPLVKNHVYTISEAYNLWNSECESRFNTLKSNEEELNRIFIDIYGLQDELDPYVENKDVTVHKADLVRDIKSFISYAVGCMFGRYSLDVEGLAYAGGEWDSSKYSSFIPDTDDIIPICDEEYFEDDIVTRFVEFVRVVYGTDTLEDNLSFIANVLGGKGAPRDVLRNYFLNDFFKDHCNTYQVTGSGKRPIYWLFDSGKKNGFKALVYIHRYTPDLIARLRTGYVHPQQARYRTQVELLQSQVDEATSTSERVKLSKQLKKINEQLLELNKYEEVVHHWADKMEPMDLDDGVKANYAKFQELLAKIK